MYQSLMILQNVEQVIVLSPDKYCKLPCYLILNKNVSLLTGRENNLPVF